MQIFLAVFAVLAILGAWSAWRRSPLYSAKVTLQLAGIVVLILALFIGVAKLNISTNTLTALLVAMIVVVGVGGSALIVHITDGHVAKLPPSARLISTHRQKIQRWIWRAITFLLVSGLAAFVVPSSWIWLPLTCGGLVLVGAGPALTGLYMRARRLDLGMTAVLADAWAHWQYTPAQWEAWAKNQLAWERSKLTQFSWKRDGKAYVKTTLLLTLTLWICAWLVLDGTNLKEKTLVALITAPALMLVFAAINWFSRRNCDRRYRRLLLAEPETYFGGEGLYCNGEFAPWTLSGSYLTEATVVADPTPLIVFVFQTFNGSSSIPVARRVLIPEGKESDLEQLQSKLRASCPKARVDLSAISTIKR